MREAIKTILTVILLTLLIWILAERAVTQQADVTATISLTSSSSELLVQMLDEKDNPESNQQIEVTLTVQGPTGRIQAIREIYPKAILFDVQKLGYVPRDEPYRIYRIRTLDLLKRRLYLEDQRSYVMITESDPDEVRFRVTRLTEQKIPVKVYDQDGIELKAVSIEPETLEAYVYLGSPTAQVTLSPIQQLQAIEAPKTFTASVDPPNRLKGENQVAIKLPEAGVIKPTLIRNPLLGVIIPMAMHGKYKVIVENYSVYDPIECRGTPEAVTRYDESDIHLQLKINESDLLQPQMQFSRPLDYYLPAGYGPIEIINKKNVPVRFRLEKITEISSE